MRMHGPACTLPCDTASINVKGDIMQNKTGKKKCQVTEEVTEGGYSGITYKSGSGDVRAERILSIFTREE